MVTHKRQHPAPVQIFVEMNQRWLDAVNARDLDAARFYAAELAKAGELLAIDPEYQLLFKGRRDDCPIDDAVEALHCISAYFQAVTDAAAGGGYRERR